MGINIDADSTERRLQQGLVLMPLASTTPLRREALLYSPHLVTKLCS